MSRSLDPCLGVSRLRQDRTMTTINLELLDALKKAGVDDDTARAAAKAFLRVEAKDQLATKADLAELKAELIKWTAGTMIAMTGIFAAIVKLL